MDIWEIKMIDVLISTYNGEKYISEQIESILRQDYSDFKIIIRDDLSTDNTMTIIKEYVEKYPNKISLLDNKGINLGSSNSFLELLRFSQSELVCFCDQDDVWLETKLSILFNYYNFQIMDKNRPILIHTGVKVVDSNLNEIPELTYSFNKNKNSMEKNFIWHIFQNDVSGCTMMINKELRKIINCIDYKNVNMIQHDWLIAQVAYLKGGKYYINDKTVLYRQHANNVIGATKLSLIGKLSLKMKKGISYKYYDQIAIITDLNLCNNSNETELIEYKNLKYKNKLYRIFWHIRKSYIREGSFALKVYQLLIC